jgi:Gpi18-like mannosyltransferase
VPRFARFRTKTAVGVLLLLGLVLREAFSFWTGHPYDFEIWIRTGHAVGTGLDPYSSLWPPLPGLSIAQFNVNLSAASYLPFWALYTGAAYQGSVAFGGGNRFVYYFLLKQAPIAGDLLTAYLLFRLTERWTGRPTRALRVMALWVVFPYAIVISAIWGQFDSIAVAILLASLWVTDAPRRNLLYGIGIFVKWVTAMFLPFELFRRRGARRAWVALGVLLPLGLTAAILLAYGWSWTGLSSVLMTGGTGIGGGMNWARLLSPFGPLAAIGDAPYATRVLSLLWVPAVVVAGWYMAARVDGVTPSLELEAVLAIVTVFLLFRWGLNEQYLLYLFAPLLLDILLFHRERQSVFLVLVGLCTLFLFVNATLGVPFLSPLGPQYVAWSHAADNAPFWGPLRLWTLNALAVVITLVLAQFAYVLLRRERSSWPWLERLGLRRPARAS